MTTALYRRYRPESFGEMIGQSQVTEPLMTALRGDRVGHAYLFSGPRGCGKTTSARILARCLNCAEGPTDTPCGKCDSCIELGRGGGGSLDVVEIDAASHNGVDDARDLRERAVFAPARDRFKIFILDEAHMVTPQGFNALLKLVEEPPEHVKFIFATTEPEKVIGTIRSRTHHYPFRLVPPAAMLEYVEQLCTQESVQVEPGVLPLVVRAGGGSPRDTLSLLDQLIAGSDSAAVPGDGSTGGVIVRYARAVALLGYTHAELLDEVVDAFAASDAAAAFAAVDRVVQTGQDPRRFVDDLLERLRDLIVVSATGQGAAAVLRGVSDEDLARMKGQADLFGTAWLSRIADLVIATLDDMTGATSPRLQLELMVARVLARGTAPTPAPAASASPGTSGRVGPAPTASVPSPAAAQTPATRSAAAPPAESAPGRSTPGDAPDAQRQEAAPAATAPASAPAAAEPGPAAAPAPVSSGPVTVERMHEGWPQILGQLENISRSSWMLASGARIVSLEGDVLTLAFASQSDVAKFKHLAAGKGPSEDLRQAILAVLGIRVKYIARHDAGGGHGGGEPRGEGPGSGDGAAASLSPSAASASPVDAPAGSGVAPGATSATAAVPAARPGGSAAAAPPRAATSAPRPPASTAPASAAPVTEWAVARIPTDADAPPPDPGPAAVPADPSGPGAPPAPSQFAVDDEPEDAASSASVRVATLAPAREGEVLHDAEIARPTAEDRDDDDLDVAADIAPDGPVPPTVAPPLTPAATIRTGGVQRYGEAVVRQMLGATFVREEPYEPPTRFS
ncbi:DNA polymerase III subunit gamma and tau [Microbacterium sp. HD4P20]|uniref:DNA polymerase III subunit gamma and tau n=1 Tax=Microbacterium sp. HD4P20 TaxID=2864874 RepID=UPI001C641929|nr:DNA polymerase III subunit gamma and tau [Microbacterium sp. HD4P20]MCP2636533.1 DNA polymerase III subunit gamma and tau [Microbacterium sp. HD4P20]